MNFANDQTFRGKRVFLTGHTGFKGSWLALWLTRMGAEVTGYAWAPPTQPNHFALAEIEARLHRHYEADIRDAERLQAAMQESCPDLVMHLAAQSVVRTSYQSPRETFDINVMGSISVLDAVAALESPPAVVMVTSDKCYENVEQVWGYRESDALGEHDPYGGSKGAAEIAIRSYRHSFFPVDQISRHGVRLASARAGNVIGGGDWTKDALIVDVFKALASNQPVEIRSPTALRPWQHVLQCLSGYLTLASKLLSNDAANYCSGWNIGPLPGNEIPVMQVVRQFIEHWGGGEVVDASRPGQPNEANILRLAIDKAIWELAWRPCWDVDQAIEKTATWYQHYLHQDQDIAELSLGQIAEYEAAMQTMQISLDRSPVKI
ncbi:CDP-glucose 4,6-dehydratase [Aporhodopirellula aestuarii]|uniref:CDP-glucose 4,6-dehydratase n=1 Tax=Aporhodopirellula aestuarii TaxID=2950107 RepID=A0ABT0UDL4_9BACT|nr:CDP-glucose 4,6-dehydratase [Aporhodopirellula aestuarii]MCM2375139.1 CDP-glucose 4,6-dehydratase [Aporhodopirellula aestuarii]